MDYEKKGLEGFTRREGYIQTIPQLGRILKQELKDINLVPEIGDFIFFRNNFYEVDSKVENQLFMGKDPDYALSSETTNFGSSFSIIVNTHISRVEKLSLIPLRGGKYPTTTIVNGGIANKIDT